MDEFEWKSLLSQIKAKRCTPFIGAGACFPTLPLGAALAEELAREAPEYPLTDRTDLMRVAQYFSLKYKLPLWPKDWMIKRLKDELAKSKYPDFLSPSEPHSVLADLELPVYLTTNYDDFMSQALRVGTRNRQVRTDYCRWNTLISQAPTVFASDRNYEPSDKEPLVYHLHGRMDDPKTLVLTEDDYIDFLVRMAKVPTLLPPRIQESIKSTSLLFIGYRLADWNFRVLFRWLVEPLEPSIRGLSVTVQLPPEEAGTVAKGRGREYLEEYFRKMEMSVFWGTASEFATKLREKWSEFAK